METLFLPIKDKDGNIIRQAQAEMMEISLGTVDKLMALLDIDEDTNSFAVLKKVSTAWKEITKILHDVFPDVTQEEWENVSINKLVPVVLAIVKYTFSELMKIPTEKN